MTDELTAAEAFRQFEEACQRAVEIIAQALRPVMDAIIEAGRKLIEYVWGLYQEAGTPYGDSDDGMLRWFKEVCEIARLEQEAIRLREWHQTLAEIRSGAWLRPSAE